MSKTVKILDSPPMTFNKRGVQQIPLAVFQINSNYIVGVYQGNISKLDILIKYRQIEKNQWSHLRTPKHIHWAVDLLIKMNHKKEETRKFLDFLIELWNKMKHDESDKMRMQNLEQENILNIIDEEAKDYKELNNYGEYSIRFLILLARLLMKQEKNNRNDAYMFKKLLEALKNYENIFQIVSTATFRRR